MKEVRDYSDDLNDIIEMLAGAERRLSEVFIVDSDRSNALSSKRRRKTTGKQMASSISSHDSRYGPPYINIIPSDKVGDCAQTLIVCVGTGDDVEKRILEAVEHISPQHCGNTTHNVLFWSASWSSDAWLRHAKSFYDGQVYQKVVKGPFGRLIW